MVRRGRIGKKKREKMTKDIIEHLRGKQYPPPYVEPVVDKANEGAAILGSLLVLHTHKDHHVRHLLF